ncbi:receptor activity-modifying protein 3-like isoform X2 [Dicentrarchus labrax]|uniref:Receptor activity-modifying protein 1 n=1 Tax=Dicentrarchus labrax TaxID=13489 RepID=A0A8C4EU25_DICLA|nr:receptor activity-modifying protein 3-like isoform X2 [Dicentrarchus labrax]
MAIERLRGIVESQTANMTDKEWRKADGNLTLIESTANSTMKPFTVTSSLNKDKESEIVDELQNQTATVITEDDENFQDQETMFPGRRCQQDILEDYSHTICGNSFHTQMLSVSTEDWCVLDNIIRPYHEMTMCLEKLSGMIGCYYPNPIIQEFFVQIHSEYFQNCAEEELQFPDAPHGVVITLTLIPVCLIPVLVYVVIWKSKVQE